MPYPSLLHPEPLQQATADPYLHRRDSDTVLAQSLWIGNAFLCLFISKENHLISKSMLQPVMLKKLKLNGSMKAYKNF